MIAIISILLSILAGTVFGEKESIDLFPTSPTISKEVCVLDTEKLKEEDELTAYSLQGLVNRERPRIYYLRKEHKGIFDFYIDKGYISKTIIYNSLWDLAKKFERSFKGFVVTDPGCEYSVNLATNLAGLREMLIIAPEKIADMKEMFPSKNQYYDLRKLKLKTLEDIHDWSLSNVYPYMRNDVLALGANGHIHYVLKDYAIAHKIPVFWLPGKNDDNYSESYEKKVLEWFKTTPANCPVIGFWPALDSDNKRIGYEEFDGVKLSGNYGKFTVVYDWKENLSFHSGSLPVNYKYEQTKVREKILRKFDPSKKYVALVMTESGDAVSYMLGDFRQRQWDDPARSQVPVSYGINPSIQYLAPAFLKYIYETASENNFFFNSISGAGYCYPFEGYDSETSDPEKEYAAYWKLTSDNMKKLDIDMLGRYTHSATLLSKEDSMTLDVISSNCKGLKSLILGMHYVPPYNAINSHCILANGVTCHHTITHWPSGNVNGQNNAYQWDDKSKDEFAANYLVGEIIRAASEGGNFIQAMFYSWFYGPRRLKIVQEELEKQGYVFVTLNEFDNLYRQSL